MPKILGFFTINVYWDTIHYLNKHGKHKNCKNQRQKRSGNFPWNCIDQSQNLLIASLSCVWVVISQGQLVFKLFFNLFTDLELFNITYVFYYIFYYDIYTEKLLIYSINLKNPKEVSISSKYNLFIMQKCLWFFLSPLSYNYKKPIT